MPRKLNKERIRTVTATATATARSRTAEVINGGQVDRATAGDIKDIK
jgi:hypothetical protein